MFSILGDLFVAPTDGFRALAPRPRWVVPFFAVMVMNLAFTAVWLRHVDPVELSRAQFEDSGWMDRIPPEQQEKAIRDQARRFPIFAWLGPVVFGPLVFTAMAGLLLFVFRFFYESEMKFGQAMGVVFWTFLVVGLVLTPATLAVLYLKGDWNVDPRMVVHANLGALVDKASVSKPVHALLDSIDLFSFWTLYLLAAGFAVMSKKSVGSALAGVGVLWGIYVMLKVGLAFIF